MPGQVLYAIIGECKKLFVSFFQLNWLLSTQTVAAVSYTMYLNMKLMKMPTQAEATYLYWNFIQFPPGTDRDRWRPSTLRDNILMAWMYRELHHPIKA